jgi:hypothetical protein
MNIETCNLNKQCNTMVVRSSGYKNVKLNICVTKTAVNATTRKTDFIKSQACLLLSFQIKL